jgi:hypothetical protein
VGVLAAVREVEVGEVGRPLVGVVLVVVRDGKSWVSVLDGGPPSDPDPEVVLEQAARTKAPIAARTVRIFLLGMVFSRGLRRRVAA